MLKLKLQSFGHLIWRADSLEKTLMLGKIEGKRRRMRWLDSITDSMSMNLSKLLEIVKDRGAWHAAVHGLAKSRSRLSEFTFTFHFHGMAKGLATLSSILAWKIPRTGEPGGLPSMGLHRVGHWSNLAAAAAGSHFRLDFPLWSLNKAVPFRRCWSLRRRSSVICPGDSGSGCNQNNRSHCYLIRLLSAELHWLLRWLCL